LGHIACVRYALQLLDVAARIGFAKGILPVGQNDEGKHRRKERPMNHPIAVVPYDGRWPQEFRRIGGTLRAAMGDLALRIDHIGSTSVPGLAAKDVIDLQITVETLDPGSIAAALASLLVIASAALTRWTRSP